MPRRRKKRFTLALKRRTRLYLKGANLGWGDFADDEDTEEEIEIVVDINLASDVLVSVSQDHLNSANYNTRDFVWWTLDFDLKPPSRTILRLTSPGDEDEASLEFEVPQTFRDSCALTGRLANNNLIISLKVGKTLNFGDFPLVDAGSGEIILTQRQAMMLMDMCVREFLEANMVGMLNAAVDHVRGRNVPTGAELQKGIHWWPGTAGELRGDTFAGGWVAFRIRRPDEKLTESDTNPRLYYKVVVGLRVVPSQAGDVGTFIAGRESERALYTYLSQAPSVNLWLLAGSPLDWIATVVSGFTSRHDPDREDWLEIHNSGHPISARFSVTPSATNRLEA